MPVTTPFSRASTATYWDVNGVVRTAAINVLRNAHYINGVLQPPLMEEARTNPMLWSTDWSNAVWSKAAFIVTTGIDDPAGGTSAVTMKSTGPVVYVSQLRAPGAALSRTNSFWMRRRLGTGPIAILSPAAGETAITTQLTTQWKRFSSTGPVVVTRQFGFRMDTTGDEVDVWGAQMDDGPLASSFIPTTTVPVTRAADIDSFLHSNPFLRASGATYLDANGFYQTAPVDVIRDRPYLNGVLQPRLLEPPRTNMLLWSRNLFNWAGPAQAVNNIVGLDGTDASGTTVTDSDAASYQIKSQSIAIPNDSQPHTARFWVRKDNDQTRYPQLKLSLGGGTPVGYGCSLDTKTGAFVSANIVGTGAVRVWDVGFWWLVELVSYNNTSGNTAATAQVYPAARTTGISGLDTVTAQGSVGIGQIQLELGVNGGTSPIFTTTTAQSRAAESFLNATPQRSLGYGRLFGSFITDGFEVGQEFTPIGFAESKRRRIIQVSAANIWTEESVWCETPAVGRSLVTHAPTVQTVPPARLPIDLRQDTVTGVYFDANVPAQLAAHPNNRVSAARRSVKGVYDDVATKAPSPIAGVVIRNVDNPRKR